MNHLKKFLTYLEQTIQATGGIQEKNKRQGLLSKDMEKANLNMRGYYSGELKKATAKPYLDEIRLKSGEYKKIEKEIKERDEESISPALFSQVAMRKNLGLKTKQQMRTDLNRVYDELEEIKQNSNLEDTYRSNLRVILRKFFTFGNMASRYVVLPLSTVIPSDNIIRALNSSNNKGADILNYTRQNREIITDVIDEDIKRYLTENGYHFKNDNDFYDNICYTKNNAKINLRDELAKIGANVKNIDSKKKILEKMPPDLPNRKPIEDEIRRLMEFKQDYLKRVEDVVESIDVETEEKNLKVMVLTWVPRQILTQSTGTIWKSCMSLSSYEDSEGGNKRFVTTGITEGVFIAWLVNLADMKTIKEPIARILIKPFMDDEENIIWWPSTIYHDGGQGNELKLFERTCRSYMLKKQKDLIKTDMTIDIKNPKKVYSDRDNQTKIIFYNKNIKPDDLVRIVDLNPAKIIDYINNGKYSILSNIDFINIVIYLINLNNSSLLKLFIDKFIQALNHKTDENKIYYITEIIHIFGKINVSDKTAEAENFFTIFFKKIIEKIPNFEIKSSIFNVSKAKDEVINICNIMAKKNRFKLINQLLQSEKNLIIDVNRIEGIVFIILNIINDNKLAFSSIVREIKKDEAPILLIFMHLFRGYKEIDNFLKTYFSDVNDQKIIDIAKKNSNNSDITSLHIAFNIQKLHSYIDDKNIKNVNYSIFNGLVKTDLINNITKLNKFDKLFNRDFSFIDAKLTDLIIDKNIFKNIFSQDYGDNDSSFRQILENLIVSGNKKLVEKFIENGIKNYDIKNTLFSCYEYDYHKNIDLFNYAIIEMLKVEADSINFNQLLDYIKMFSQHLTKKELNNDAFDMLVKNLKISRNSSIIYDVYILLECIDYDKSKIANFVELYKIDLDLIKENTIKLFRDSELRDFFECQFLNINKTVKFFEEIEFFKDKNGVLLNSLLSSTNEEIKIKMTNIVLDKYPDTLDDSKIKSIFHMFLQTSSKLTSEEIKIKEKIRAIVKIKPELIKIEASIALVTALGLTLPNYHKFSVEMMYEKLEDFLESDLFKKLVTKSNTTTKTKKRLQTTDYEFISIVPKSIYNKKIEEKMIPETVLKMIKSNKYLNDELEKAKSASD
jgi:hypothetical protein